jgi:hypothetical protein
MGSKFFLDIYPVLRHLTMRYFQLVMLCFICLAKSYGQTGTRSYHTVVVEITKEKKPKKISTKVEITSPFPGGDSSWIQSLEEKLNQSIPVKNGAKAGKYIVSVSFLIEKDGSLTDIRCLNDPDFEMCKHVMAAIKRNFPGKRWGTQIDSSGKVRQYHTTSTTPQDE